MIMMMMMAVGGLQPTNRLGSWVEQPNRMNLSLLESDEEECHGEESFQSNKVQKARMGRFSAILRKSKCVGKTD